MINALRGNLFHPVLAAGAWTGSESTTGRQIDLIFYSMLALCLFLIAVISVLIVAYIIKYRSSVDAFREAGSKSQWVAELTWVGLPFLIVLSVFVWAASVYAGANAAPLNARTIYVVGKQWMWKVEHPQGRREINTLHIPVGEPVKLVMTSQDVIHSFYVPDFRVKQDVLPGRYTTLWFEATRPGTAHLFCAEYCGTDHARMRGSVVAMTPADFQRWLEDEIGAQGVARELPNDVRQQLAARKKGPFFQFGCDACHWPGTAVSAPSLAGLFGSTVKLRSGKSVVVDEAFLRRSILEPNADIVAGFDAPSVMPTFKGQLNERDLMRLIEFIKELRDGWPEEIAP